MTTPSSPQSPERVNPKTQGPKPEYPRPPIARPGSDAEMRPAADRGEKSYRGLGRLADKVALITGADSGIGRAVAIAFAREGADLLISYMPEEEHDAGATRDVGRERLPSCRQGAWRHSRRASLHLDGGAGVPGVRPTGSPRQ